MADYSRFLPFSQRSSGDESAVTSDRRAALADVLREAARILSSAPALAREGLVTAFVADARLDREPEASDLDRLADAVLAGRRRNVAALARTVRALLLLAGHLDATPAIADATTGAVALYGATSGPFERRVVLQGHTVQATDAEWAFGRGPTLEGPALAITAFVLGVSDVPPAPVRR